MGLSLKSHLLNDSVKGGAENPLHTLCFIQGLHVP